MSDAMAAIGEAQLKVGELRKIRNFQGVSQITDLLKETAHWSQVTKLSCVLLVLLALPATAQERLLPGDDGWIESITLKLDSIDSERMKHRVAIWTGDGFKWKHGAWVCVGRINWKLPIPLPRANGVRNGQRVKHKGCEFQWVAAGETFLLAEVPKGWRSLPYCAAGASSCGQGWGGCGLTVSPLQIETAQRRMRDDQERESR